MSYIMNTYHFDRNGLSTDLTGCKACKLLTDGQPVMNMTITLPIDSAKLVSWFPNLSTCDQKYAIYYIKLR
jgi:hypothetical protein